MKEFFLIAIVLMLTANFTSFAGNAEKFTYDSRQVEKLMSGLNQLEDYLNTNPGLTFTEMKTSGNALLEGIAAALPLVALFDDGKPKKSGGGGGFILGCCVGAGVTALAAGAVAYWMYYAIFQTALI